MVDIYPFRALRYDLNKLAAEGAGLNEVVTPPYDVIDGHAQERYYGRHRANFIRIDLGRAEAGDNESNNPHTRADLTLREWEQSGILTAESEPALYAYSQSWDQDGHAVTRKGVLALLKLEDLESGKVLPHEHTLKGPKQERLALMQTTASNLSQVFFIYEDAERKMEALLYDHAPAGDWSEATDVDGTVHRFRPVTDKRITDELKALFADKALLIADGHHRYETALTLQREARAQVKAETGQEPAPGSLLTDYAVVFLSNMADPGLLVFPTHRIVYSFPDGWTPERFEAALYERFEEVRHDETFAYRPAGAAPGHLKKLRVKAEFAPAHLPEGLRDFDAAILEEVVFKGILGTTGEAMKAAHQLGFYRDEAEVDPLYANGETVGGFYLAAPSVKLVHAICQAGHRMPQKSTYFYPKILSGLVVYPYREFTAAEGHALTGVLEAQPLQQLGATPAKA